MINLIQHEKFGTVRTQVVDGEPWFVAKDVCDVLELTNSRKAISLLEDDEKGVTISDTLGGKQTLNTVNESGLYNLIFQSRKPKAREFRKWVTGVVLPCIRRYGCYPAPLHYVPVNFKEHTEIFETLMLRQIVKVESLRVRRNLVKIMDFYIDQLSLINNH